MTAPTTRATSGFETLAKALTRHAARLARARAIERRAGDSRVGARWRSPHLLWPGFTGED